MSNRSTKHFTEAQLQQAAEGLELFIRKEKLFDGLLEWDGVEVKIDDVNNGMNIWLSLKPSAIQAVENDMEETQGQLRQAFNLFVWKISDALSQYGYEGDMEDTDATIHCHTKEKKEIDNSIGIIPGYGPKFIEIDWGIWPTEYEPGMFPRYEPSQMNAYDNFYHIVHSLIHYRECSGEIETTLQEYQRVGKQQQHSGDQEETLGVLEEFIRNDLDLNLPKPRGF